MVNSFFIAVIILLLIVVFMSLCFYRSSRKVKETQQLLLDQEKIQFMKAMMGSLTHDLNSLIGVCISSLSYQIDQNKRVTQDFNNDKLKRSDFEAYLNTERESFSITMRNLELAVEMVESFVSEKTRILVLKPYLEKMVKSVAHDKNIKPVDIRIHCPDELVYQGKTGTLLRVLYNLIKNSIEHGFNDTQKGFISIDVRQEDGYTRIRLSDNGKGIPEESKDKIFDAFYSTRSVKGGSGLGLFIVKNLVTQSLEGDISFTSEPGKGTLFILNLPALLLEEVRHE